MCIASYCTLLFKCVCKPMIQENECIYKQIFCNQYEIFKEPCILLPKNKIVQHLYQFIIRWVTLWQQITQWLPTERLPFNQFSHHKLLSLIYVLDLRSNFYVGHLQTCNNKTKTVEPSDTIKLLMASSIFQGKSLG